MVLFKLPLFKVENVVAHRVGGKLVLGGFDPFGQRTKYPRAKPNKAMALIGMQLVLLTAASRFSFASYSETENTFAVGT